MATDILKIFRSQNTVFTFKEIALMLGATDRNQLKRKIHYYIKKGELYPIRRGIYAKDKNYNIFELATKIYTPSYISLETVLGQEGITFQYYGQIFAISYLSREIECEKQKYSFKKIKDIILTNPAGIEKRENYYRASKERAFLDRIYLYGNYYFDNLQPIDWEKCFEIVKIYDTKAMQKRLNSHYKDFKNA